MLRQDARSRQNNRAQYFRQPEFDFFAGRVVPLDAQSLPEYSLANPPPPQRH